MLVAQNNLFRSFRRGKKKSSHHANIDNVVSEYYSDKKIWYWYGMNITTLSSNTKSSYCNVKTLILENFLRNVRTHRTRLLQLRNMAFSEDWYLLKLPSNTWNINCTLYATRFFKSLPGLSVIGVIYLFKIMMSFYIHI